MKSDNAGEETSMTVPSEIDGAAPVLAHHEIEIEAPLGEVWRLHTDVNTWTSWQKDITAASIEGAFEVGNSFRWSSYGLGVISTIYAITDHARVLWGGTGAGITGIHEWRFAETPGGVRVTTDESFAGQPVEADATTMQSMLDASLVSWLDHLKQAAESRA
jgi:Polyketide cyclase / dehydrase and lipid transport